MKRNFLKLRSWAVIALIGSFTFTSCSDDDDNGGGGDGNEDEIVMEMVRLCREKLLLVKP